MSNLTSLIKNLSESEAGFWGNVVGATIGVIGAFLVGLVAIYLERRHQKADYKRTLIRAHGDKVIELEIFLNHYILATMKNERHLRQCIALKDAGSYSMTLPRSIPRTLDQEGYILNRQLLNELVSLNMAIDLNNQLIEDFTTNYTQLSQFLMPIVAQKEAGTLDNKVVGDQHAQLLALAESARISTHNIYERSLKVMAIVHLHGEKSQVEKFTKVDELEGYVVDGDAVRSKVEELRVKYSESTVFSDV